MEVDGSLRTSENGKSHEESRQTENEQLRSQRLVPNRPKRLRQWSNKSMLKAIETIMKGEMGQNRTALGTKSFLLC